MHTSLVLADSISEYVKCTEEIKEITGSKETQYNRQDEVMKEFYNGIDYLLAGDDGEETFLERLKEDLSLKNNDLL